MNDKYNPNDIDSIYKHAKKLEGKTFRNVYDEDDVFIYKISDNVSDAYASSAYENKKRKGGLGELIEEKHFYYKKDNKSQADFENVGVELKVTPFKINKNLSLSAKERLIISMINYNRIITQDFYNSNAWKKMQNILLVYYLYDSEAQDRLDYEIKYVNMFSPSNEDLKIIKEDFYKIKQKVIEGKAHELSESDTLYLSAATKASSSKDRTSQPNSDIPAKPRAFALKSSYMSYVLNTRIANNIQKDDAILKEDSNKTLERYVIDEIDKYKGSSELELFNIFFEDNIKVSKDMYNRLALKILGVKTDNAEEFEKANIVVKAIRVEENNKIRESMSFPTFKIKELIKQKWFESDIFNYFSETKFLFVVFKKNGANYYLKGAKFWNMPFSDIDNTLKKEWHDVVNIFKEGLKFNIADANSPIKNNLPKKTDTNILHARPHASKSVYMINNIKYGNGDLNRDGDILPNGDIMTKQCFWLNNDYILKQIKDLLI